MEQQQEYMTDTKGRLIPKDLVKEIDQVQDELVNILCSRAKQMQAKLQGFKASTYDELISFMDLSAQEYGVTRGGQKGNLHLVSYDGKRRVSLAIADHRIFDASLQAAKDLIDECVKDWTHGARAEVQALIQDAFQIDKDGNIATWRVLSLQKLNIEDARWQRAMKAISDSVRSIGTKEYVRFYERADVESKWQAISLDIAKL